GGRLAEFARQGAAVGVKLDFDCGFVRCMFSNDALAILEQAGTHFAAHCNPILDIDLDGTAIHCFPLTGKCEIPAGSGLDAGAMRDVLSSQTQVYRSAGIYKECSTCRFKQTGECNGGCLAATMRRFRHPEIHLTLPAGYVESELFPGVPV
ncbi:MAG: hypothetical protein K8I60_11500, partial [Anaerolineae bacterium]|nr:hypothetical protein [Anaerolineae bacterium]